MGSPSAFASRERKMPAGRLDELAVRCRGVVEDGLGLASLGFVVLRRGGVCIATRCLPFFPRRALLGAFFAYSTQVFRIDAGHEMRM